MEIMGWKPVVGSLGSRVGSVRVGCEIGLEEFEGDWLMGVPGVDVVGAKSFRR